MIDKENAIKALEKAWNYLDVQKRTFESVVMRNNGALDGVHAFDDTLDGIKNAIALLKAQEQSQRDYESVIEMTQYCESYESTYNPEDGSL